MVQIAYLAPITNPMNKGDYVWEPGLRVGGGENGENVELRGTNLQKKNVKRG